MITKRGSKHMLERMVALLTLICGAPVMLTVAAAIVAESGFPVFFQQQRLGLHGKPFRLWKFRKFHPNVCSDTGPLTMANDARFSRVGALLAASKLDELPQLWNIVRGEMAFVGPRPEVPEFAACFAGPLRALLDFRPGIFGPTQVAFRDEAALYPPEIAAPEFYRKVLFPAKAMLDLSYYPTRSSGADLNWMIRGILAVCRASRSQDMAEARRKAIAAVMMQDKG